MKAIMRDWAEFKDSGIEWIGQIPQHWYTENIKYHFDVIAGATPDSKNPEYWDGEIIWVTPADYKTEDKYVKNGKRSLSLSGYQSCSASLVPEGSIIFSKRAPIGTVALSATELCTNQGCLSCVPRKNVDSKYYYYVMSIATEEFELKGSGTTFKEISANNFVNTKLPYPMYEEQQLIANYLDDRCSKIDAIIAEAKASIEEYKELKQAVIDKYILGFNDIHIKLSRLGTLKNGLNFTHFEENGNIKFLGVGCFKDNTILSTEDSFEDIHIDFEIDDEYLLINGDIIFVRSNGSKELVGRSIMVDNITFPLTYSGFCIRFRNQHKEIVDNKFLLYYFRTSYFKESLLKHSNDSTNINNLNQGMLNAIRISAPIKNEQLMIVGKLEKKLSTMEEVISEKQSLIADLEAYKKSLIYEVVTGKRKVVA